jgi:aspartate 1-decarboxylase
MERIFFKSKIHRAAITDANLDYEGSITIDSDLMEAAGILPFERVDVVNINTGARFTTYTIKGKKGSGEICLNGGAARLGEIGDLVIIITYVNLKEEEISRLKPVTVLVDKNNKIKSVQEKTIN